MLGYKFINIANKIHNNKYKYFINNDKNLDHYKEKIDILCPVHGMFKQIAKTHLNKGCLKCYMLLKKEIFIKKAKNKHKNKYDYNNINYTGSKNKVIITCPIHGDFKVKPNNHIANKTGCPICKLSKGELKIAKLLNDLNISFKREYNIPDSNTKFRYDFYLPDLNILIEYDGRQHFEPVTAWGGEKELLNIQKRDKTKNKIAKEKGYKLIRIKYTEINNIKKYLLFRISRYFKYCVNNKWYRNFLELCKGEHLPGNIKPKDVKQYLIYK